MRDDRELRLGQAAGRQHTVVGLRDVRAAGLDREAVRRAVRRGLLHPMFPRTWCVGHPPTTRDAWHMAGVLSAGPGARLAGVSACQQYGLFKRRVGTVHVVRRGKPARHGRLHVHSLSAMPPRRQRNGIPIVPVEEALLGLAADPAVTDRDVRRAIRQAQVDKLTTHARLVAHAGQARRRPGVRRFRAIAGDRPAPTRSELEDAAVALVRRYGFDPQCNVVVDGQEADMVVDGVIVELDSEAFHDNPLGALDDAARHATWRARRRRVERWTWDDVTARPVRTIRRLQAAVASAG